VPPLQNAFIAYTALIDQINTSSSALRWRQYIKSLHTEAFQMYYSHFQGIQIGSNAEVSA